MQKDLHDQQVMEWFKTRRTTNPTKPIDCVRLKDQSRTCEDCGKRLRHQRTVRISQRTWPQRHWHHYCEACRCYRDPITGEYSIPYGDSDRFNRYLDKNWQRR